MGSSFAVIASSTPSMVWRYALAFFLVVVAIGLVFMLVRAGRTLASVEKLITDLDKEMVPLLGKAGTTVDEVNEELAKVNDITASVVQMTQKVDSTTRAVETAITTPVKKAAAFSAGVTQSVSSFVHKYTSERGGFPGRKSAGEPAPQTAPEPSPEPGPESAFAPAAEPAASEAAEAPWVPAAEAEADGEPTPEAPSS